MFLGHDEILSRVRSDKLIENLEEKNIEGSGVDLRIDSLYCLSSDDAFIGISDRRIPKVNKLDKFVLKPKCYYLFKTMERVNMPSDLVAFMFPRSSLFRCGISLRTAVIDPGYRGELTVGLFNESERDVRLEMGARVLQLVFSLVSGGTQLYDGRYQDGKIR